MQAKNVLRILINYSYNVLLIVNNRIVIPSRIVLVLTIDLTGPNTLSNVKDIRITFEIVTILLILLDYSISDLL